MTDAQDRNSSVSLRRMAVPKRSEVLIDDLRSRILSGELPPGSMLPPERTLVEQTGLSRMTVREALRLLEAEGLLTIRPGRTGGSSVRKLDGTTISRHLDTYFLSQEVSLETLFEVREALAPACAALAARRRTPADVEALRQSNELIRDGSAFVPEFFARYLDWHVQLAQVSGNEVMRAVMQSTTRGLWAIADNKRLQDIELRRLAVQAHERVIQAVAAGDEDAARRRMLRHVSAFSSAVSQVPGLIETLAPLAEPAEPAEPARPRRSPKKAKGRTAEATGH